ncbi:MAG: hypothetical protein WCI73_03035 [Phycisphaerae bacterium]
MNDRDTSALPASSRRSKRWTVLIFLLMFIAGGGYMVHRFFANMFPRPTTDVRDYHAQLEQWMEVSDPRLFTHFPPTIPSQARNVRFSAQLGFGQGGGHIQLRLELPSEEIARLEKQFPAATTTHVAATSTAPAWAVLRPPFYTADTHEEEIDSIMEDYRIQVLYAIDRSSGTLVSGEFAGVAISPKRHEIIYWLEEIK